MIYMKFLVIVIDIVRLNLDLDVVFNCFILFFSFKLVVFDIWFMVLLVVKV